MTVTVSIRTPTCHDALDEVMQALAENFPVGLLHVVEVSVDGDVIMLTVPDATIEDAEELAAATCYRDGIRVDWGGARCRSSTRLPSEPSTAPIRWSTCGRCRTRASTSL